MRNCGCRGRCQCKRAKEIVYPTREEVKNTHSEETVCHVYPSHTRVINHHTIRNEYAYPHSTSYENRVREVDVRGVSEGPRRGVGGVGDRRYGGDVRGVRDYGCGYGDDRVGGAKDCGCLGRCNCGGRRRRSWW